MDFFASQERARRLSGWLVTLFLLAVILIVVAVYAVLAAVLLADEPGYWDPGLFSVTAVAIGVVVAGASLVRSVGLRSGGGTAVAEMLGGRLVSPETPATDERRLLNVVEEISIAAGTPVPAVYVLDNESRINAFAAGYSPEDAVVGMTRGALDTFSREELQAVVAHEFSHIVNRDIRLNIRLTGLLFGILALGFAGRILLRASFYGRGGRRDGRAVAAMVAVGLALFVAGYLGVLLGRVIRAAVSRQREFLADAAAVQFTRNPDAMAGALKKIGAAGSKLSTTAAEEVSHFFFADGLSAGLVGRLWSTHPPLLERIRRVEPSFDGDFSKVRLEQPAEAEPPPEAGRRERPGFALPIAPAVAAAAVLVAEGAQAESVGSEVDLGSLPRELNRAAHEPFSAVALMYALMLDGDEEARRPQLALLERELASPLRAEVLRLLPAVKLTPPAHRLALVDLAAPAVRQLSDAQAQKLMTVLANLAAVDHRLSVFEFALKTAVRHRLAATHGSAPRASFASLRQVEFDARVVLAVLALAGSSDPEAGRAAYTSGVRALGLAPAEALPACTAEDVRQALDALSASTTSIRSRVVQACAATVLHDEVVLEDEAHLMRAIAAALDTPLPDFLPGFGASRLPSAG